MSSGEASPTSNSLSPSTTPNTLANQAPKFGTVIPNRIFVGGIATNTTDQELKVFFAAYGAVKDTKIICDRAGVSKGYGFVTFETQEDAEKIIKKDALNLIFKDRKLNIGPAVRKQHAFPRLLDGISTGGAGATMFFAPNPYAYAAQSGLSVLPGAECSSYQTIQQQSVGAQQHGLSGYANTAAAAAMMIPQQVYMAHPQYQYASPSAQQTVSTQASAALQYANQQWNTTARCYQPASGTAGTANNYLYAAGLQQQQQELIAYSPAASAHAQYFEMPDGTMLEQNHNENNSQHANQEYANPNRADCNFTEQQQKAGLISIPPRSVQQSPAPPQFHPVSTASPQPPPTKRMAPMTLGPHLALNQRCYQAAPSYILKPAAIATKARHIPMTPSPGHIYAATGAPITYMGPPTAKVDDIRMKFDQDGQLAASVAPPTPPTTPATAVGH